MEHIFATCNHGTMPLAVIVIQAAAERVIIVGEVIVVREQ